MTRSVLVAAVLAGLSAAAANAQTVICAANSRTFTITNPVFPYVIDSQDAPILKLVAGNTYTFNCTNVPSFHPVYLTASSTGGSGAAGLATGAVGGYTAGDTCGSGCARTSFTITPTAAGLQSFYYQCHIHSGLGNRIDILVRPTITDAPDAITVDAGGMAMFMVSASAPGNPTLTYQWLKNGQPITGATGPMLHLENVQSGDVADYSVTVGNSCATTTSAAAHLTVRCGPADVAGLGAGLGADGQLTVDDVVAYLSAFFANNLAVADLAQLGGNPGADNQITVDDLVFFLARFFAGC